MTHVEISKNRVQDLDIAVNIPLPLTISERDQRSENGFRSNAIDVPSTPLTSRRVQPTRPEHRSFAARNLATESAHSDAIPSGRRPPQFPNRPTATTKRGGPFSHPPGEPGRDSAGTGGDVDRRDLGEIPAAKETLHGTELGDTSAPAAPSGCAHRERSPSQVLTPHSYGRRPLATLT